MGTQIRLRQVTFPWQPLSHLTKSNHRPQCYCLLRHVLIAPDFRARGIMLCMFRTSRLWLVSRLGFGNCALIKAVLPIQTYWIVRFVEKFASSFFNDSIHSLPKSLSKIVSCRSSSLKAFIGHERITRPVHNIGDHVPYSFEQWCGLFKVPQYIRNQRIVVFARSDWLLTLRMVSTIYLNLHQLGE